MTAEAGLDGRYSVAFPRRWWWPVCRSRDLGRKPVAVELMETPLALFRDQAGHPHAVVDRCPHRNAPLSLGRVTEAGVLECGYHGWCFAGDGRCALVPGLLDGDTAASPARNVPAHAATERDGFVWVWGVADSVPEREPFPLPLLAEKGSGEAVFSCDLDCTMHAALENSLDVPHTAYLHRGLFRGGSVPADVTAIRRQVPGGLEVEFVGEPIGFGPIRPRSERTFEHWDRFFLPGIAQIEYRVPGWLRIVNTILHLPMGPFRTRAWFVVRFWTRGPASLVRPIVLLRGRGILGQDAGMLARQAETTRRFAGERYTSTELDLMGNGIWRLLRRAEREDTGEPVPSAAESAADSDGDGLSARTVTFKV